MAPPNLRNQRQLLKLIRTRGEVSRAELSKLTGLTRPTISTVVGELLDRLGLHWPDCAFMGDDLIDLGVMSQCGLAIAPANARPAVRERAHAVTDSRGGNGAVREAAEFILDAQGKLEGLVAGYLDAQ